MRTISYSIFRLLDIRLFPVYLFVYGLYIYAQGNII